MMAISPITGVVDISSITGTLNQVIAQVNGTSATVPAIQLPAGATAIYSVVQCNAYVGPCMRVKRLSDNAQTDIPFSGGIADWRSADGFAAGSILQITKIYDQSGNNNTLVPANSNPPNFMPGGNFNGIRPFGLFSTSPGASQNMVCPVTMNANSWTVYQVLNSYTQASSQGWFSFQDTPANGAEPVLAFLPQGTPFNVNLTLPTTGGVIGFVPPANLISASFSGNGSCNVNGTVANLGQGSSSKLGQFCFGGSQLFSFYWMNGGIFFTAVYPTNHSAATQVAINNVALAPFYDRTVKNKQVVYGGHSINNGYNATFGYDPMHQAGFGRSSVEDALGLYALPALPDWQCRNFGVTGQTLATEIANAPGQYVNTVGALPAGYWKNIIVVGDPTNDIANSGGYASTAAAQTAMSTLFTSLQTYVVSLKTAGFTGVVLSTTLPRTGFALGSGNFMEDARVYFNNLIRTNQVGSGYVVADRCAPGPFSTQTAYSNTTYYGSDGIHPTNLGYSILGNICRAAILSI